MKWLPSFTKLFLLAVAGLALTVIGGVGFIQGSGSYTTTSLFHFIQLLSMLLMVLALLLILLKFFMRLDSKA